MHLRLIDRIRIEQKQINRTPLIFHGKTVMVKPSQCPEGFLYIIQ